MNESYNEPDVTVMDGLKKRPLGPLGPKLIAIAVLSYTKLYLPTGPPETRAFVGPIVAQASGRGSLVWATSTRECINWMKDFRASLSSLDITQR